MHFSKDTDERMLHNKTIKHLKIIDFRCPKIIDFEGLKKQMIEMGDMN
jgi:hypothetical protein